MAPPAMVVDDESSSNTPEEEVEYATPTGKSPADDATDSDQSVKINSVSAVTPHISGDDSAAFHSNKTSPVDSGAGTNIDTPSDIEIPDASTSTREVSETSRLSAAPNGSTAAQDLPFATSLDSSSPQSRLRTPLSRAPNSNSESPAVAPETAPVASPRSIRIEKEVAKLNEIIEDASPEALHKLLRNEWRAFLYTPLDEEHLTYIMRACIKNSTPNVIERAVREVLLKAEFRPLVFKSALKHITAEQLVNQLPSPVLYETVDKALTHATAPALIQRLPRNVLDEVLVHHLRVSPAKNLVNWLAKAGRLGYSVDDIIDDHDEAVSPPGLPPATDARNIDDVVMHEAPYHQPQYQRLPQQQPPHHPPPQANFHHPATRSDHLLAEQEKNAEIQRQNDVIQRQHQELQSRGQHPQTDPLGRCATCGFNAPTRGGQAYHAHKKPCENASKQPGANGWAASCPNCGQMFTQSGGHTYHKMNKVCSSGKFADDTPTEPVRPTFSTAPRPAPAPFRTTSTSTPILPPPRPGKEIPRPPLHTPAPSSTPQTTQSYQLLDGQAAVQAIDPKARVNPSQLSSEKKARMDAKLEVEDQKYQETLAEIALRADLTEGDKEKRRVSAKNANATKKSQIRKSFGVSLRLREKDKIALRSAPLSSPILSSSASKPVPSYLSPHIPSSYLSTPSSGFSPINGPSPPNANGPGPQQVPYPPIIPNGSRRPDPRTSRFSILKANKVPLLQGHQNPPAHRDKRQRTSSFGEQGKPSSSSANWMQPLARTQTPYGPASSTVMMEVSSKDAASKYPKRVPVAAAQAKWEQLQPRVKAQDGENTRQNFIEIDSSGSDAEQTSRRAKVLDVLVGKDKLLTSTEDTESETGSRPTSSVSGRGKFMARRGGRQSLNR
jgi:hypothetical protein